MIAIGTATPETDAESLRAALRPTTRRTLILVDDVDRIERTATEDRLCELLSDATQEVAIVVAGTGDALRNSLRGLIPLIRRTTNGLLLAPTSTLDGELIGVRLTRSHLGATKGRAIIALNGEPVAAQIAIVTSTTR